MPVNFDYRSEFPVTENWVFLNHAAVAPLSKRARDRILAYADDMMTNGNVHEADWWGQIEKDRLLAARFVGAEPEEIAFVKNTSEGLAFVAEGLPWQPGDNVVVPEGEYPANVYPWLHLASKGVQVRTAPARGARIHLDDLARAMNEHTRLLAISWVQFGTGFRSDLAAIGRLCREHDVEFCVDAIQGLGAFPIDVKTLQIDYLSADGHKWLVGPEGAGLFYIRRDKLEKVRPISVGWKSVIGFRNFDAIDYRLKPDASRFEAGTFNLPGTLGLGASLALLLEVGITSIEKSVKELTNYLVERLTELGADVVSLREEPAWSGIVSFSLADRDPDLVVRHLRDRRIVISQRSGRLRASPHFYNNQADIDRLIDALEFCRR